MTPKCPACKRRFYMRPSQFKRGCRCCSNSCRSRWFVGGRSHFWKGGKTISRGYVLMKMPSHPRAKKNGYVPEHIVVAEKALGRSLRPGEIVHHKNGIKSDNRKRNLEVMPESEHRKHHALEAWKPGGFFYGRSR